MRLGGLRGGARRRRRALVGLRCRVRRGAVAPRPVAGTSCRVFPADNWWNARRLARCRWTPAAAPGCPGCTPSATCTRTSGRRTATGRTTASRSRSSAARTARCRCASTTASESDRERYPLGADTRIEGGRGSAGDKHAIVVDKGDCRLYETWLTRVRDGRWRAGSGATWTLSSNRLRPNGWTSADAAGLPILPGLLRWNEVKAGRVDHAIRFTTDATAAAHLWPARHDAGSGTATALPADGGALPAAGVVRRERAGRPTPGWSSRR